MSDTAANVMDRVRMLVDDRNPSAYEMSGPRMLTILSSRLIDTVAELPVGDTEHAGFITLVSGTADYTLGGVGPSFIGLLSVSPATTGVPLARTSLEAVVTRLLVGDSDAPVMFATYERASDNTVRIRFAPKPGAEQNGDTVSFWTQDASSGVATSGATILMQPSLLRAVEKAVAAEWVVSATDEALQRRGISRGIAQLWMQDWKDGIVKERARLFNLRRAGQVVLRNG